MFLMFPIMPALSSCHNALWFTLSLLHSSVLQKVGLGDTGGKGKTPHGGMLKVER